MEMGQGDVEDEGTSCQEAPVVPQRFEVAA